MCLFHIDLQVFFKYVLYKFPLEIHSESFNCLFKKFLIQVVSSLSVLSHTKGLCILFR